MFLFFLILILTLILSLTVDGLPTFYPTYRPTSSPTIVEPGRFMYRLLKNETVTVFKNYNNITFRHLNSSPTNITIRSGSQDFQPIAWVNLTYRVWDLVTNTTSTKILFQPCNPGHPSKIPGTPLVQQDGIFSCPTIEKCILTSNCMDLLSPVGIGYTKFPDLRACWCSYSVISYPSLSAPILRSGEIHTLSLFEGKMTPLLTQTPPSDVLGLIFCNSFIEREINCQLYAQDQAYLFQCAQEPIGCYDQTLGWPFGGFADQNLGCVYTPDWSKWTTCHYRGISSIFNNLTYSNKDGVLVDPWSSTLRSKYNWVKSNSSLSIFTTLLVPNVSSYQTYLIQADPFTYLLSSSPPPMVNFSLSRAPNSEELACYSSAITLGVPPVTMCNGVTWETQTGPAFRMAGLEYVSVLLPDQTAVTVTLTLTTLAPNVKGVEVYNSWGELCGSVYSDGFGVIGSYYVFLCINTPSAGKLHLSPSITIRLIGQESIYDMPNSNLNSEVVRTVQDPLGSILGTSGFTPFSNTTWPLMYPMFYDGGVFLNKKAWPQRQRVLLETLSLFPYTPFKVQMNYTKSNTDSAYTASAWASLASLITNSNVYPENIALRGEEWKYITNPINLTSPKDQAWMRAEWATWLAPKWCGGDETQCKTFSLGECVINPDEVQVWYAADTFSGYIPAGKEGGCRCLNEYSKGFFYSQLFCQRCLPGYGPATLDELSGAIQYNGLVSQTYNGYPTNPIGVDEFERNWICRLPFGVDSLVGALDSVNTCGGHGLLTINTTRVGLGLGVWDTGGGEGEGKKLIIGCEKLGVIGKTYTLSSKVTSPFNLIYTTIEDEILTVIGTTQGYEIYLNGSSCIGTSPLVVVFPIPWTIGLVCDNNGLGLKYEMTCLNSLIFSSSDVSIGLKYTKNIFLLTLNPS